MQLGRNIPVTRLPVVPASLFSIVLGVAGLAGGWRVAARLWHVPQWVGETLLALAALIWLIILVLYVAKWLWAREEALAEFRDPVQSCFVGLVGVATLLVAVAAAPHSKAIGWTLFAIGVAIQFSFSIYVTGSWWRGGRDLGATTPALYLPLGAGNFVTAIALDALGQPGWGILFFGAGLFSWLAIESALLHRLMVHTPMPDKLRPTLGIQLAPPTVGALAWLSANGGVPDLFAQAMIGYALLQALILLSLLPWITQQVFTPGYWAFSFGATALTVVLLRMLEQKDPVPAADLALPFFLLVNVLVAMLAIRTIVLLARGRLLSTAH
jgi:tellurite resistance protein